MLYIYSSNTYSSSSDNYRIKYEQKDEEYCKQLSNNSKSFRTQRLQTPKYFKSKRRSSDHFDGADDLEVPLSSSSIDRSTENKIHENHKLCK